MANQSINQSVLLSGTWPIESNTQTHNHAHTYNTYPIYTDSTGLILEICWQKVIKTSTTVFIFVTLAHRIFTASTRVFY